MRWTIIAIYMLAGIAVAILASSCSTTQFQELDKRVFYKRDLTISVNGKSYEGVVTVPRETSYKIQIESEANVDMIIWRGCAREDSGTPKKPGLFNFLSQRKIYYTYTPQPGLEDLGTCPFRLEAYDSTKNQHGWAFLEFEHPNYKVKFELDCNGRRAAFDGVGTCQQKAGLLMRAHFGERIDFAKPMPEGCPMPRYDVEGLYEWEAGPGECIYHFQNEKYELGKFIVIGYQGILIRGGV